MPILFIVFGIIFILIFFNGIKFKNVKNKYFLLMFTMFFELGFFVGDLLIFGLSFNFLHMLLYFTVITIFIDKLKISNFLLSLIVAGFYYLLMDTSFSEFLYTNSFYALFAFMPTVFICGFSNKLIFLLIALLGLTCVNVYYEFNLLTFAAVDFVSLFEVIAIFVVYNFLLYLIKLGVNNYGKKNIYNSFVASDQFVFFSRLNCFCRKR